MFLMSTTTTTRTTNDAWVNHRMNFEATSNISTMQIKCPNHESLSLSVSFILYISIHNHSSKQSEICQVPCTLKICISEINKQKQKKNFLAFPRSLSLSDRCWNHVKKCFNSHQIICQFHLLLAFSSPSL